jgi:hypothetical protein
LNQKLKRLKKLADNEDKSSNSISNELEIKSKSPLKLKRLKKLTDNEEKSSGYSKTSSKESKIKTKSSTPKSSSKSSTPKSSSKSLSKSLSPKSSSKSSTPKSSSKSSSKSSTPKSYSKSLSPKSSLSKSSTPKSSSKSLSPKSSLSKSSTPKSSSKPLSQNETTLESISPRRSERLRKRITKRTTIKKSNSTKPTRISKRLKKKKRVPEDYEMSKSQTKTPQSKSASNHLLTLGAVRRSKRLKKNIMRTGKKTITGATNSTVSTPITKEVLSQFPRSFKIFGGGIPAFQKSTFKKAIRDLHLSKLIKRN